MIKKLTHLKRNLGLSLLLLHSSIGAQAISSDQPNSYAEVIEKARNGQYDQAITYLTKQIEQNPLDQAALRDLMVVQTWAGLHKAAIHTYENRASATRSSDPDYVKLAIARAYLAIDNPKAALELVSETQQSLRNQALPAAWQIIELKALVIQNDNIAIRKKVTALLASARTAQSNAHLSQVLVQSYLVHDALRAAGKAIELEPGVDEWKINYVNVLHQSGSSKRALEYAKENQLLLPATQQLALETDAVAELTRQAVYSARSQRKRYDVAHRAITEYEALLHKWRQILPADHPALIRLEYDKLEALHAADESAQVTAEYQSLVDRGFPLPDYASDPVAAAYLNQHEPEQAARVYETYGSVAPLDPEAKWQRQINKNYIYQESSRYEEADKALNVAIDDTPMWLHIKGNVEAEPNPFYTDTQSAIALRHLYKGNTQLAHKLTLDMLEQAPMSNTIRADHAEVLRAEGLARQAEQQLKIVESTEPLEQSLLLHQAHTAIDLREWSQARTLTEYLVNGYPKNLAVQNLNRRWQIQQLNELQVSAGRGFGPSNTITGEHELWLNTKLYSAPLADNWRPFVGYQLNKSSFDDQKIRQHTGLAGVQWQGRDNLVEAEVNTQHYRKQQVVGTRISWDHNLNDHWLGGVQFATNSVSTPLRALSNGIRAKRADLYMQWQAHHQNVWRLSFSPSRFSDGNQRYELLLNGQTRLATSDTFLIDGLLEAYASRNSRGNTASNERSPYFNPKNDYLLLPKVGVEQLLYHRYEQRWSHRLELGAGSYYQKSYGSGSVLAASYRHDVDVNDRLSTALGITAVRRPYDGKKENNFNVFFEFNWRF